MSPFTLFVAGIAHIDPAGPEALATWIEQSKDRHGSNPEFAAVEYREDNAAIDDASRGRIEETFKSVLADIPDTDLRAIGCGYHYEPNTVRTTLPGVMMIWLDRDRGTPLNEIEIIASENYVLAHDLLRMWTSAPTKEYASLLSREIRMRARIEAHKGAYYRDQAWAHIIGETPKPEGGWGIAVVGNAHANEQDTNCFLGLLRQAGVQCQATSLLSV